MISLLRTTVGRKIVAAASGALLWGFVVFHMFGNLKALLGRDAQGRWEIDVYAAYLRVAGEPLVPAGVLLWSARLGLLAALGLHLYAVVTLAARNRGARPTPYRVVRYAEASLPARTMLVSGLLLLAFVVLHVMHFTTGTLAPQPFVHGAVYANMYASFRHAPVALAYVAAVAVLGLHLWHGFWSALQTFGLDDVHRHAALRRLAAWTTVLLVAGFACVPIAFLAGWLPAPDAAMAARLPTGGLP